MPWNGRSLLYELRLFYPIVDRALGRESTTSDVTGRLSKTRCPTPGEGVVQMETGRGD